MQSKDFDSVKPYVYWIKNLETGIKYIGSRYGNIKLNLTPNQDLGIVYFSSGKLKKEFTKFPDKFKIKVLSTFDTPEEAISDEVIKQLLVEVLKENQKLKIENKIFKKKLD